MTGDGRSGPVWLHAVVREPLAGRARRWLGSGRRRADEGAEAERAGLEGTRRVSRDGLAAVVSPAGAAGDEGPADDGAAGEDARLDRHARAVEALAGSDTVVPAPPGLRAAGEEAVRAFLGRAELALQEALELFEGACQVRLHVRRHPGRRASDRPPPAGEDVDAAAAASGLYHRLRRHARAARRLPADGDDVLTAAFLVPRAGWSEGRSLAAGWQEHQPGLAADVTGPWAPYDFVRMFPVEGP